MSILNVNRIQPVGSGQTVTISATNVDVGSATVTAGTFSGNVTGNVNSTGVTTVTTLNVGIAVTANSSGVQVGAGKSIRIYGSTSGYADLITSATAGSPLLTLPDTTGTLDRLNRAGNILQVAHATLTTGFSVTSTQTGTGYYADVTGLSTSITPSSTSNKILIFTNMYVGKTTVSYSYQQHYRIKRNGTPVILGTSQGGRPTSTGRINMYSSDTSSGQYQMAMLSGVHYDSPNSTSSLTYQIEMGGYNASPVIYVNRSETWQALANDYDSIPVSTLTLMEVAG